MGTPGRRAGGVLAALVVIVLVAGALLAWSARTKATRVRAGDEWLRVVTTTPILYSFTVNIAGEDAAVRNLLPPGASPHDYALRPEDAQAVHQADVIIENGLGLEAFLSRAIALNPTASRITASEGIATLPALPEGDAHAGDAGGDADEEQAESGEDPHVWVDPQRAQQMVQTIARGLAAADARNAERYAERAAAYLERLRALDADLQSLLRETPTKAFVAFHPTWRYFAERYGLRQAAVVERVPGREPTARELAELAADIRAAGVRALITEPQFSSRVAEVLARDLDLTIAQANPEGDALAADGYERLMRENAAAFARALGGLRP